MKTAWKVSKYGVFSGPYFPVFGLNMERYGVSGLNTGKYGPEKTPYLDTSHTAEFLLELFHINSSLLSNRFGMKHLIALAIFDCISYILIFVSLQWLGIISNLLDRFASQPKWWVVVYFAILVLFTEFR